MAADLNMTERRRIGIEVVREDKVTYDPSRAVWFVDGEEVGNWDRRTLSELRTAGLITPTDPKSISAVELTELGKSTVETAGEGV